MPVADLYATAEALAERAPSIFGDGEGGLDAAKKDAAESLLEAISRAIDSRTKRSPGAFMPSPEEPTTRVLYGNDKPCLDLPEYIHGSVDLTVTTIAGVRAPLVAEYRGRLCIVDSRGVLQRLEVWRDGVPYTIKARWGYADTPADIREACLIEASKRARLNSGDVSGVVTTIMRDGAALQRDEFTPAFNELIKPYVLAEREDDDDGQGIVGVGELRSSDFTGR
ncbi:MAG: hypothetical protein WCF57_20255 [Pyrinomonadaceae bacterium]